MKSQITTLKNGLRVASSQVKEAETVSVGLWINTGTAYERENINGISHFLEHMVFKGTETRDSFRISEEIENLGGHMNAYTAREFTAFYAKMLKDDAPVAIDVLADLLLNSTFTAKEIDKEHDVVVQEIKQAVDTPDDVIFDYLQTTAFPNQALGRTILGPEEKVRSFAKATLDGYMKTNYAAENMVACAVGNIRHDDFVEMVEEKLSSLRPHASFTPDKQKYVGGFYNEKRKIEQAQVAIGFEGTKYTSEDYYPAILLSTILGGGMSSRLFQEIREKRGLVYTVYSFANAHTQTGLFGIYAGTNEHQIKELIPVIGAEINKIRTEYVADQELIRAKVQTKAGMLMGLESSSASSEFLARHLLVFNKSPNIDDIVKKIESITKEDLLKLANKIFSTTPSYALLGNFKKSPDYEDLEKALK